MIINGIFGFIWNISKFIFIFSIITFTLVYTAKNITPKCFNNNSLKVCSSSIHDEGLCAGKNIYKDESIGHISRIYSGIDFNDTSFGKFLNHSQKPNIEFLPLYRDGYIDIYGYAIKDIDQDTELTADYTSKWSPKPNFVDTNDNYNLFSH